MRHLQPEELIDLAEGTRRETSAPHLQTCETCRKQLADVKAMMGTAAQAHVPEPSPLFWDHLSARVRDVVAAEGLPHRGSWFGWTLSGVLTPLSIGGFAALVIAAALVFGPRHVPGSVTPPSAHAGAVAEAARAAEPDDPSLDMVADLAAQVDWDASGDNGVGLRPHEDAADKVVSQLSDGERRELQRLLQEELSHSGN